MEKEKEVKSTKSKIITILLIVSILCVFGIMAYAVFCSDKGDNPKEDTNLEGLADTCSWENDNDEIEAKSIKFKNKKVTIDPVNGTINNTKYDTSIMESFMPLRVYPATDILIIEGYGNGGILSMLFFDKDLKQLKINEEYYIIQPNEDSQKTNDFSDKTLEVKFLNGNYHYEGSSIGIHNVYIDSNFGDCEGWDGYINLAQKELEKYKDEIINGEATLTYDGTKLNFEITKKTTVWDKYGKAIESNSKEYCISVAQ